MLPQESLQQWERDGFLMLPGAVSAPIVDQVARNFEILRKSSEKAANPKDEYGFGPNIVSYHIQRPEILDLFFESKILETVQELFACEPLLMQTTYFEVSAEFFCHSEQPFMFSEPDSQKAVVWTAIDDVHLDAGPFCYIPGSHRWPLTRGEDIQRRFPEWGNAVQEAIRSGEWPRRKIELLREGHVLMDRYTEEVLEQINQQSAERRPRTERVWQPMKRGDAVIVHGRLLHGSFPRVNRSLSRRAISAIFVGLNSKVWNMESFYTLKNNEFTDQNTRKLDIKAYGKGHFVADSVRFY